MNNRAGHCKRPPSQRRPPLPQLHQPSGRIPRVLTCQLSSHDSVDLNSDESSIKSTNALNFNKLSSPPNITGWRYSDEKQTIIASLNDPLSDIHLMSKEQIWRKYAHNYDQKKTVKNLAYLLKQHERRKVPFLLRRIAHEIRPANVRRATKLSLGRLGIKRAADGTCSIN